MPMTKCTWEISDINGHNNAPLHLLNIEPKLKQPRQWPFQSWRRFDVVTLQVSLLRKQQCAPKDVIKMGQIDC
jgi:hypothetical protein